MYLIAFCIILILLVCWLGYRLDRSQKRARKLDKMLRSVSCPKPADAAAAPATSAPAIPTPMPAASATSMPEPKIEKFRTNVAHLFGSQMA